MEVDNRLGRGGAGRYEWALVVGGLPASPSLACRALALRHLDSVSNCVVHFGHLKEHVACSTPSCAAATADQMTNAYAYERLMLLPMHDA